MRTLLLLLSALPLSVVACARKDEAQIESSEVAAAKPAPAAPAQQATPATIAAKRLFLDVHELGPGKVTAQAVAQAHQKDLAIEGKYDVDLKAYWVDEKQGKIYCLAEAPSASALEAVHREAHGLLASQTLEVSADNLSWQPTAGMNLYMDVHHFGPGKVNAQAVADAHQKDLAAQAKHGVKYLDYWFDAASGTVMCLTEAPNAEASLAVHKEAHGLMPDSIERVSEGR